MKRGAETQLTKDNADDDEVEEVTGASFMKASQSTLAGRTIKPLPNRGQNKQLPSAPIGGFGAIPDPSAKVEFGSGFKDTGKSSFTFNAPTPLSIPAQPQRSTFNFQSGSGSDASKELISVLNSTPKSIDMEMDDANVYDAETPAQNYYVSLRGLNVSFLSTVAIFYKNNAFVDMGIFFDEYTNKRREIEQEYERRKAKSAGKTNGTLSNGPASSSPFGQPPTTTVAPPAPPAAFSFGSSSKPTSTSNTAPTLGSGFTPKGTSASSAPLFSLPSTTSSTNKTPLFGNSSSSTPKQSLFGTPSSSPFGSTTAESKPSGFSFGASSGNTATGAGETDSTKASTGLFSASNASTATSTETSPSGTISSKSSPFAFGSAKPASGSIGNPVGFTFGSKSPTPTPSTDATKTTTTSSSSPFGTPTTSTSPFGSSSAAPPAGFTFGASSTSLFGSFGKVAPAPAAAQESKSEEATSSSDAPETPTEDASKPKVLGENPNDLEGEGEEDEETVHTSRVKIFRFDKSVTPMKWAEMGIGMLRIKKRKDDDSYRLLSRNSANGKIMMNFKLYSGMVIKREKQTLNFTGHDEGGSAHQYKVRIKSEADAIALHGAIQNVLPS